MKYTTSELAKILGVSGNTIRRFDEKGYLSSKRSEENEYRQFDASDVEKLMYVMRYRREEMSHSGFLLTGTYRLNRQADL